MGRCEIGNARVYITTRQKCGQGIRLGKWFELKGYASKKDLLNSFRELYKDETEPVICYLDWQDIPPGFISETDISKNLFGLINGFKELTPTDKIGFSIWLGTHQDAIPDVRADKIIQAFKGCYQGYFA